MALPHPLHTQGVAGGGQTGPRPLLPRADEVALARSAAPAAVSDSAAVFVLAAEGYELAEPGTSGAACYVSRDWVGSREPHCFDPEGARTIMPMMMRRVELLHRGMTRAYADTVIALGIREGRYRLPARPVMSYMMSEAQVLYAPNGQPTGKWQPHLMIYVPYITARDLGISGRPSAGMPFVVDPGLPTANIMVLMRDFVPVQRRASPP